MVPPVEMTRSRMADDCRSAGPSSKPFSGHPRPFSPCRSQKRRRQVVPAGLFSWPNVIDEPRSCLDRKAPHQSCAEISQQPSSVILATAWLEQEAAKPRGALRRLNTIRISGIGSPANSPGLVQPWLCDGYRVTRPSELALFLIGFRI